MRALRLEVCGVGLGDAIDSDSAVDSVDIHIEGHWVFLGSRRSGQLERRTGDAAASEPLPRLRAAYLSFVARCARPSMPSVRLPLEPAVTSAFRPPGNLAPRQAGRQQRWGGLPMRWRRRRR